MSSKILINRLECDIIDTCNLNCKSCGHVSPFFKKNYYSFDEYKKDLTELSKVLHCNEFVIMGGEPLLVGNKILDYVEQAKCVGISDRIRLVTNGILLHRIEISTLKRFDEIWVSIYPIKEKQEIEEWCEKNKGILPISIMHRERFSNCFSKERLTEERAEQSWINCKSQGGKGCNLLYDGHLFLCAPDAKFYRVLKDLGIELKGKRGVSIHAPDLKSKLQEYFMSTNKLPSCYHCFGYIGDHVWTEE